MVVTTTCKQRVAECFTNPLVFFVEVGKRYYAKIVLGVGSGTPSESDTDLFMPITETEREAEITVTDNYVEYHVRYMPEEINGYTYTEVGLFERVPEIHDPELGYIPAPYTQGEMFIHTMLDTPIEKTEDILLDIYIRITFT